MKVFDCVIASAAKQSSSLRGGRWIASSQGLLAMTGETALFHGCISSQLTEVVGFARAQPTLRNRLVAIRFKAVSRHCERSEAIQFCARGRMDCFVARAP